MLIQGDAARLPLPDALFHCIVFSPPYWALRIYQGNQGDEPLGLEATPERHIERLVAVCGELKRVLRDDGVMYMNYGDCYSAQQGKGFKPGGGKNVAANGERRPQPKGLSQGNLHLMPHRVALALQADGWILRQDLVWSKPNPMPESVNGWHFRAKTCECILQGDRVRETVNNPKGIIGNSGRLVPVGRRAGGREGADENCPICGGKGTVGPPILHKGSWRHTRSHEYVFMFVKSMGYYCNQEAVRVPHAQSSMERGYPKGGHGKHLKNKDEKAYATSFNQMLVDKGKRPTPGGCNPRDVLHIPTAPYKGSHYATYPPNLIRPLILASCPQRCCPECGQAWAPVVESDRAVSGYRPTCECGEWHCKCGAYAIQYRSRKDEIDAIQRQGESEGLSKSMGTQPMLPILREGICPQCGEKLVHIPFNWVPGIVFDPFMGSGTTGQVAESLGLRWVGSDISYEYLNEQARKRVSTPLKKSKKVVKREKQMQLILPEDNGSNGQRS